ncbi:hypothetical protein cypCar_00030838 [Cyprinus carpio]|nr:hypothetical protein cypCar_00030838 [Cyprinus carpio]
MSSRRQLNRSLSSDGRSYYGGSDISPQNRRVGCRSYLSSVRSESRSTLCSVMAQLTEEIQPSFETTLKSKAVSEDTNVKFSCVVSGHPVPEVTWYKDDVQLDRYCGLPKYEISRDDKTHSLQIYNCTLEDAAIYQASAQNSRGIVSCSGVLEVGTMSEYKIHQNYFAKLKLRNENRRREQEEPRNACKENVPAARENVRVSSPERAQRKRRSPMETRAAGSPSEEKAMEVDALSPTPPVQESVSTSVHEISNCEMITNRDKDGQGLRYGHDTVHNASSKQTNEHYVKKKIKISTEAKEGIKENRQNGRREEIMNESGASTEEMEVQNTVDQITSVTEYENKMDITDRQISEKQSVKVNKSASKESKRAQGAQTASVSESRNKMDKTDTRKFEKTSAYTNKSGSEESKRAQGAQITSATESKNKMDIDTKATEKQSERVNKMVSEKPKGAQGVQITSVTESRIKMDITTIKNQKMSVKANKSPSEESERAQGAHIASATESRNRIGITVTKTNEKQPVKVNKSAFEESKRAHHASVTESRNKMDITVTKTNEKQSEKVNKGVSEEPKSAQCAQIASMTESSSKMDIKDTKKNEKQSEKVNKSVLEESKRAQGVQIASVTESSSNMDITDTKTNEKRSEKMHKSVSEESKRAQGAQITSVTDSKIKVDITDTKKNDKQSEKAKESSSESKRVQKPITTQKQLPLKFSMTTQMNKVVENTKLTKSSDKGTSNLQPQALDNIQNCNPRVIDNKLMDFDDHRNKTPAGTCVRIFPHSCGGNDVNVDTGERNASACSLRSLRTVQADLPKPAGNENVKPKSAEKDKENQFKVPQVIRKIRPEVFDASGHLKLWCQFFNIVSDSTIKWYKDEVEIAEIKRSAGDETQVCLAIIQMSKRDCGVYRCTITNEYGKDFTEYLLSTEFLSNILLHEKLKEVGEEIEMTPLIFSKGLADAGCWGSKFYGRVTTEEAQVGLGCEHKTRRLKVIYGLDPVFESGSSCFMKVRSPIAYESREETVLAERNLQITKQDCRIQNMAREYFKIFATETRVIESFGAALEVIPLYFMYLPASSIPYATVEAELKGVYLRYCGLDRTGSLVFNEKLEVAQKCSCLQHWIYQWTNGNVLFSRLEGVDTILTNIGIAVRSKGYQGFPCEANPKVFEQFQIQHQCNYFCGLLNLKPLKAPETLQTSTRPKGSSSPLLQHKTAPSSSSPQTPRKATKSPKVSRKLNPQTST